jgi:hypothetical protein
MELVVYRQDDPPAYQRAVERLNAVEGTAIAYLNPEDFGSLDEVNLAIAHAEERLRPAGEEAALVGIEYCIELLSAKRPAEQILKGYASILGDIPVALLSKALKAACTKATFHKLPPPGAFCQAVEGETEALRATLSRLRRHRDRMQLANRIRSHHAKPAVEAPGLTGPRGGRHFTGMTERSPS